MVVSSSTAVKLAFDGHVRRRFYKILSGAELRRQRFHDLRHACASLLLAQNVHPRVVMETLGHSTIALTMNTYSHVLPAAQREAADKMGDILEGSQSGYRLVAVKMAVRTTRRRPLTDRVVVFFSL